MLLLHIWYPVFTGLGVGYAFMSIPPVADQFMGLFGGGYGGLSLLLSGLLWSHALSQIPAGLLVDRIGAHRGMALGSGCAVLFNLIPFLAPENMALAIAMRFLTGLCTGVLFLATLKLFAILTPPGQMAKAQGFYGGAFGFGTMLPYFTLPYLGDWGWGYSYLITGASFAAIFAGAFLPSKEASRPPQRRIAAGDGPGIAELLVRTFKAPDIWLMGLLHGIFYGTLNTLGQWLPAVLADLDGVPLKEWGLAATLALLLGSCSRTLSGYFLKLVSRTTAMCLCLFLTFALYAGLGAAGNAHIGLALGLCMALVCGLCHGAIFAMGGLILPPAFMGTALGFLNSLANLFNVGLTLSFGYLRDATGSFGPALYLTGAAALATLALLHRRIARLDERLG